MLNRTLLAMTFGALIAASTLTINRIPEPPVEKPHPVQQMDPATMQLFIPTPPPIDNGLVCYPWMNRMHIGGCPMVIL